MTDTATTVGTLDQNEVVFPHLGIDIHVNSTAFSIGGLDIQWYGLLITLGLLLAMIYAFTQVRKYGLNPDRFLDAVIGGIIGGIVGARAYYVILEWDTYAGDWKSIFNLRQGGLAIYGGILGGAIALLLFCAVRHMPLLQLADVLVPALALGQGIGRWGNYFNMEAYGRLITNPQWQFFPAAVLIPVDSGYEWHMATFFYESCVDVLIFLVLWFGVRKRKRWNGQLLAVYMLMYGIGRAVIEGLRMDSLYSGSIRISQIVSITLAAVGLIWLLIGTFARKNPQREG